MRLNPNEYVYRALATLLMLFLAGAWATGCSSNQTADDEIMQDLLHKAQSKLVCVQNDSREPIRVKLYDADTGARFATVFVHPLDDARKWVRREHFQNGVSVGVDPTGSGEVYPEALRDILTQASGVPLPLSIGTLKGGNRPFAHSARMPECP